MSFFCLRMTKASATVRRKKQEREPVLSNSNGVPTDSVPLMASAHTTWLPADSYVGESTMSEDRTSSMSKVVVHRQPNSPLLYDALNEKNFDLAAGLIEENRGLQFVSRQHNANTVLHVALLQNAPLPLISALIEKGLDLNMPNDMGRTPVYIAARHNVSIETMRYVIQMGGRINQVDHYQYTPLMAACYHGSSLSLVGALLQLGADMHMLDSQGKTARDWAIQGNFPYTANFLKEIPIIPVLCSVYIHRLGVNSPLRQLPKDLIKLLRDMLCVPSPKSAENGTNEA